MLNLDKTSEDFRVHLTTFEARLDDFIDEAKAHLAR
jgi:hypothetical protein